MTPRLPLALAALCAATACTPSPDAVGHLAEPALITTRASAPPNAPPDSCWSKDTTPAVIETVTEQIVLQPAEITTDGRVLRPATTKTETRQQIVQERRELWFEIPCELRNDADFIATLQRALAARSLYGGPISGLYDSRTRAAVRAYQRPQGLDSGVLSLPAARNLGLVAVPRS